MSLEGIKLQFDRRIDPLVVPPVHTVVTRDAESAAAAVLSGKCVLQRNRLALSSRNGERLRYHFKTIR